ncbi:hypothetical protein [Mucilaginibacter polytrichastri]|uniref:Outer membrane protein beta-barrel domain-containing protein n=1 Tax=Mucilaginibacter polytrichastri TaxID=1302689 RepID=A0A1Q6A4Z2_9SPHI|nr:hypothetical protein [Mucilaginibacter polytrichastri]OKS89067.1 hypothetical protein RG47T_4547 [Mucilaginibacter polytrichastri]SFS96057.1 hypothetical protein SAMN04487890_107108 [Mucilaginibacter polytrichastri]
MKRPLLVLFIITLLTTLAHERAQAQLLSDQSNIGAMGGQVLIGSQGVGLEGRYGFSETLSARIGGSFLPASANNVFSIGGFKSNTDVSAKFYNVHLLADYIPSENLPWLRVVGGAAYLYKAQGKVGVIPTGTYKVANYNISAAEMGDLNIDVSWKGIAPYLGFGFLPSFPSQMFNINFDVGTYYLSQPKSTIIGTKLLSDNYKLEPQVNSNLKSYRWLPVLQVNFNFKIN